MKILFDQKPYKLILQTKCDNNLIGLLKNTLWGTKETVYQHQHTEQNINQVIDPHFFNLKKKEELVGTCCFSKRTIYKYGNIYDVWYSRYFSITSKRQGGIFGNMILKHIRAYFESETKTPSLFYAFVDASNIRSHKLLSYIGFQKIRSFETLTFSRLFPKKDQRVSALHVNDINIMNELLQDAYKDYSLAHFDTLFLKGNYFVLKQDDEIVAGIRVNTAHWIIRRLAGWTGILIIKFLPHIPVLSRLFNPDKFDFIAFDGVYSKDGYEKELFVLMESVCSSLKISTGLMWLDSESSLFHKLKGAGNWGILDKLKENIPAYVVAAFKNIPEEEQKQIINSPVYISAIDII